MNIALKCGDLFSYVNIALLHSLYIRIKYQIERNTLLMKIKYITSLKVLSVLSMIGGIVSAFVLAYYLGIEIETEGYYYIREIETRNWGKTILYFSIGILSGYISYLIFASLAEILQVQQAIINEQFKTNQIIMSLSHSQTKDREPSADEWKCQCGKINKKYVTTCACGREYNILVKDIIK